MSSNKEPITIVELDMDYCSLTFGNSPCTAALGGTTEKKCFNTFFTCKDRENYDKTTITYRFVQPRSSYPKGATTFPCLIDTSTRSSKANIAGADDQMYALGKRGRISARFFDFTYHDRFMDKYQSERKSGAAQLSGVGYNPVEKGTFWTKFKARNPNYVNRPMRELTGYIQDGVLTIETTRNFIITEIKGPDTNGDVTIEGKDVLKLADDDRAVAPKQSRGQLTVDIDDTELATFDLNPSGIGDEYDASGFAAIGSEIVSFVRDGDEITLTGRGLRGTEASSHSIDDTFQQTFSPRLRRIDFVVRDLLRDYAGVDPSFIPFSDWTDEAQRWAPTLKLTTDIVKPTGVAKLIGELAILGVTIWWDDVDQEIKFLVNRPIDEEDVKTFSDDKNIIKASQEDHDEDRITQIIFNTVQIDPSAGVETENFRRGRLFIDAEASLPQAYGDTRIKEVNCRWLNHGDDATVRILSIRFLNKFNTQPVRYVLDLDYRDDVSVADVVGLRSYVVTSDTGELEDQLSQVIMREDIENGHKIRLTLQRFEFDGRFAYITENTRPTYSMSTDAQKARGAYFVDEGTLLFGDGGEPYQFI